VKAEDVGDRVLRYRREIGLVLLGATLYMGALAARIDVSTRFIELFPQTHRNVVLSNRFRSFGGDETLMLMLQVRKGDIFNAASLRKIRQLTQEMDMLPGVNHAQIFSLASYRTVYAEAVPGGVEIRPLMRTSVPSSPEEIAALKRHIRAHREQLRHLISDDDKGTIITASFHERLVNHRELLDKLDRLVATHRDANHDIYIAGEPVIRGYGYRHLPAMVGIFVVSCGAIVAVLYAALGSYSGWWVPLLTALCAAVWGLGFTGWMGYAFDPLMLVMPLVLTARNLSHGIAWQRRYQRLFNQLEDRHSACTAAIDDTLVPGMVAIAADVTAVIFISFSAIPVLDHLGRAGAVWLGAGLPMVYIFQPIVMSYLPAPKVGLLDGHKLNLARRLEPLVERVVEIPVSGGVAAKSLLCAAAGLLVLGVFSVFKLEVGYREPGTPLYRPQSRINQDTGVIARQFPVDEAWVVFSTPPFPHNQSVLAPNVLRLADHLRDYLLKDPAVMQVVSFASSVITPFNQVFHYGYPKYFGMPMDVQESGNLWYLFNRSAPGHMQRYLADSRAKETCIRILLRDHTATTLERVQLEIENFLKSYIERNPAYGKVEATYMAGAAGLYAAADDVIYRVSLSNAGLVLISLFILCTIVFRSFLAGLLLVFASALAILAAFACMYLFGIGLTIDTLPVISLAIGLGINQAIAIVSRIRAEAADGYLLDDAIRIGIKHAGEGAIGATCVILAGVFPWSFSPALFHHQMAIVLAVLLPVNLLATLGVLPAAISGLRPRFITLLEHPAGERHLKDRMAHQPLSATAPAVPN
jgi:predicted RND superfamily exporter protein